MSVHAADRPLLVYQVLPWEYRREVLVAWARLLVAPEGLEGDESLEDLYRDVLAARRSMDAAIVWRRWLRRPGANVPAHARRKPATLRVGGKRVEALHVLFSDPVGEPPLEVLHEYLEPLVETPLDLDVQLAVSLDQEVCDFWRTSRDAQEMLRVAAYVLSRKQLVALAVVVAETVMPFAPEDARIGMAVDMARAWTKGTAERSAVVADAARQARTASQSTSRVVSLSAQTAALVCELVEYSENELANMAGYVATDAALAYWEERLLEDSTVSSAILDRRLAELAKLLRAAFPRCKGVVTEALWRTHALAGGRVERPSLLGGLRMFRARG